MDFLTPGRRAEVVVDFLDHLLLTLPDSDPRTKNERTEAVRVVRGLVVKFLQHHRKDSGHEADE